MDTATDMMRCQSVIRPGPHRLHWSTSLICDPSTEDQTETLNEGCESITVIITLGQSWRASITCMQAMFLFYFLP